MVLVIVGADTNMPVESLHWLEMKMSVSTLLSTDTVQERMYSEPLNGIPTSTMTTLGAGTEECEIRMDRLREYSIVTLDYRVFYVILTVSY